MLTHALLALAAGAEWVVAPRSAIRDGGPLVAYAEQVGARLVHAPADTWALLARAKKPLSKKATAWIDVAQSSPELVAALHGTGFTVVCAYRSASLGVSVAAGIVETADDCSLFYRPLLPGGLSVVDAGGRRVGAGNAGWLRLDAWEPAAPASATTDSLVRWRSDGVLQFLGTSARDAGIPSVSAERSTPIEHARTETELALAEVWRELLGRPDIGVTDGFFEVGGHSMLAIRLMAQIESRIGHRLPLSALLEAPTIRQLASMLSGDASVHSVVLIRRGKGGMPPVFLVHDGDGETLLYRNLANRLRPEHSVYGLQPLAGAGLQMLHTRIPEMAAYYVDNIRSVQAHGPYLLGGLCAGGVIAFEVARLLQEQGEVVAMVALLDIGDVEAPVKYGQRLKRFASAFRNDDSVPLTQHVINSLTLATSKVRNFVAYSQETRAEEAETTRRASKLRGLLDNSKPVPEELRSLSVRQLYYFARSSYLPAGLFQGDVVLLRAMQGDGSQGDTPCIEQYAEPLFGWSRRVTGQVVAFDVPGGHSTMLQEPHVEILAARLQDCIDRAYRDAPPTHPRRLADATERRHAASAPALSAVR
jgi:thioesterase domain-containing protein